MRLCFGSESSKCCRSLKFELIKSLQSRDEDQEEPGGITKVLRVFLGLSTRRVLGLPHTSTVTREASQA